MGMYLKQQQSNTELHNRLTNQLDKRLNQPRRKVAPKAHAIATEDPIVSFRAVWFIVLTTGGIVAILLAFLQRQHPDSVTTTLGARSLGYLGLASIILGCLSLAFKRHNKSHHA
jgi:hypothetical protein